MFCRVVVEGIEIPEAIVVPAVALREGNEVYLVRKSTAASEKGNPQSPATANDRGVLEVRRVQVRHRMGDEVVVESGIEPGELVVTSLLSMVTDGMQVRIIVEGDAP
jgi:hypothetical protein